MTFLPLLLAAAGVSGQPAIREPTPRERAAIVWTVKDEWKYDSTATDATKLLSRSSAQTGEARPGAQLAFSVVVFKDVGRSLRVLGIVTPRQPLSADATHVPLVSIVRIGRGKIVASEAWYGRDDGTCCASGRARTIWSYRRGKLVPERTTVLRKPSRKRTA